MMDGVNDIFGRTEKQILLCLYQLETGNISNRDLYYVAVKMKHRHPSSSMVRRLSNYIIKQLPMKKNLG